MIRFTLGAAALLFSTVSLGGDLSPEAIAGATTVDTAQAKALFDQGAAFVDLRKNSDWEAGRIPGAIHLELKKVFNEAALADEVKKDEPVVFYCNGPKCPRSAVATEKAVSWGYSKAYYYRDGLPAWRAASFPVE